MKELHMSDQMDDAELPVNVDSLEDLLETLRDAKGALSSQADQIGQMRGMFDDADGAIQSAVDDGEHADERLANAILHVEGLIVTRDFDRSMEDEARKTTRRIRDEAVRRAGIEIRHAVADGVKVPDTPALLRIRDDIIHMLYEDIEKGNENDRDSEEAQIVLDITEVRTLAELLLGSAIAVDRLSNPEPVEVLVNCTGGVVQDIIVVEGQNPVTVYVEDNDEDEEIGAEENDELAHLQNEDGTGDHPEFSASLYRTRGDAFATDGRRWTTLRSEAERLERDQRPLTAADLVGSDG